MFRRLLTAALVLAGGVFAQNVTESEVSTSCPGGECVKIFLCTDDHLITDGAGIIDIRFSEDNPCGHHLLKCCPIDDDEENQNARIPPSTTVTTAPDGDRTQNPQPVTPTTGSSLGSEKTGVDTPLVAHKCGVRHEDGVGFRISGNSDGESEYGEFPWMAAILRQEQTFDLVKAVYHCGGSLIHPSVVLTAAHCVHNKKPNALRVRLGEWDTRTEYEQFEYQDRNISQIVVHENFYKGGLFNDIALLFLDAPVRIMETVDTICMPPQDHNFNHNRCFASGWGKDLYGKEGKYQVILKKVEVPVVPSEPCQEAVRAHRGKRFMLDKSFICAGGEKGRDTCKGDGGSPLVCPVPGTVDRYYQAGIVAWGVDCGLAGVPAMYANVPMFRKWIDERLLEKNLSVDSYVYA